MIQVQNGSIWLAHSDLIFLVIGFSVFPEHLDEADSLENNRNEDFKILYALLFILCFFSNGFVPSISTFIAMPYGVKGPWFDSFLACKGHCSPSMGKGQFIHRPQFGKPNKSLSCIDNIEHRCQSDRLHNCQLQANCFPPSILPYFCHYNGKTGNKTYFTNKPPSRL